MNYIRYQLSQTIKKSVGLKRQSQRSGMTTVQTEVLFGQIAAKNFWFGITIKNQGKIHVRGKIDRIDQLVTPNQPI